MCEDGRKLRDELDEVKNELRKTRADLDKLSGEYDYEMEKNLASLKNMMPVVRVTQMQVHALALILPEAQQRYWVEKVVNDAAREAMDVKIVIGENSITTRIEKELWIDFDLLGSY